MSGDSGPVVQYLEQKMYSDIRPLDRGSFGDVMSALSPRKEEVAVKVIDKRSYWRVEEDIWPLLDHPHVLPCLEVMQLPGLGLKLFVSPRHPTSLFLLAQTAEFQADVNGLNRIRNWLRDVLGGLEYLHHAGFAHMDIKTDNVLVTSRDSAVICDFSGLALTEMKITRLCSPLKFRPPECWSSTGGVEGVPFDMWTYGLMAFNILAGHWPQINLQDFEGWTWEDNARPVLSYGLQSATLGYFMKAALPCVRINDEDVHSALHFLLRMLRRNPSQRPTAREAANDAFLRILPPVEPSPVDVRPPPAPEVASIRNIEQVMACGDYVNAAYIDESEENQVRHEPSKSDVTGGHRTGIGKRLKTWMVKKIRRFQMKKHNYVPLSNVLWD